MEEFLTHLEEFALEALMPLPGVRTILTFAPPAWRGLWALTWIVGIIYVITRIYESLRRSALHHQMATAALVTPPAADRAAAEPAPAGPPPAVGASRGDPIPGRSLTDVATEGTRGRLADPDRPASATLRFSLATALVGVALLVASRVARTRPTAEPATLDDDNPARAAAESFAFASRGWRQAGSACVATLEVIGGSPEPRTLAFYVMDTGGAVLGRDVLRVPSLTPGAFHEFRIAGLDCDSFSEWQVQGQR